MQYVVVHAFQDKYTRKYYGVGSIYETTDEQRAFDLENGGYIVPDNTEAATAAKAMAKGNANSQEMQQAFKQVQKEVEPKTVVNGKVVPLKAAQAAEAAFAIKNTQTGVQAHHANTSEAVAAGGLAQQKSQAAQMQESATQSSAQYAHNMQSGQQALEKELQAAPSSSPNEAANAKAYNSQAMQGEAMGAYTSQQYQQEQAQHMQQHSQAAQAAAARAEQTNAADAQHAQAAEESKAAKTAQAKAKAKGNQ